jgi:hypothetical protein
MKHRNKKIEANNKWQSYLNKQYRISRKEIVDYFVKLAIK